MRKSLKTYPKGRLKYKAKWSNHYSLWGENPTWTFHEMRKLKGNYHVLASNAAAAKSKLVWM